MRTAPPSTAGIDGKFFSLKHTNQIGRAVPCVLTFCTSFSSFEDMSIVTSNTISRSEHTIEELPLP